MIKVTRKTTESEMTVSIEPGKIKPDYRKRICTTIPFLNHMIEHIAWRSGMNIEASVKLDEFTLSHVICEDLGMALGRAVQKYVSDNIREGVCGFGDGIGIIDEAKAESAVSFESRSLFVIDYHGTNPGDETEGMYREDLETFLLGFTQGASCTLHIDVIRGENGHHIWEAVFRSLGTCLGRAVYKDEKRRGMTSGVAGTIEWDIQCE